MTDAINEVVLLENELNNLAPKNISGAATVVNKAIALSIAAFGKENHHAPMFKDLKFYPYGTIQATGQDIALEAWENGKAAFLYLTSLMKTEIEYKKKFPQEIEFPSKITIPWVIKNAPASLVWKLAAFMVVGAATIYSLGTQHEKNLNLLKSLINPPQIERPKPKEAPHNKSFKADAVGRWSVITPANANGACANLWPEASHSKQQNQPHT